MRFHELLAAGLVSACLSAPAAGAAALEGVEFPARREWGGTELRLNGVGLLRYRILFKGYVAALYLGDGVEPARALEDVPRRLEIEYFWPIQANAFAAATRDGIARNVGADTLRRLEGPIARLNQLYTDVEPGDRYALTYVPGQGTELAINGEPLGRIEGADFSSALFGIWLGPRSFDASLREKLLAGR
jgi:hypothetical protein